MELEKLSSEAAFQILSEIPSDNESLTSDDALEDEANPEIELQIPDICDEVETQTSGEESSDWSSEDEEPLANFQRNSNTITWTTQENYYKDPTPFAEKFGPNIPENIASPIETFSCLFRDELFEHIAFQTNLYSAQKNGNRTPPPTSVEEIKAFFGINLLMGLTKKPSYKDYWSSQMHIRDQFISSVMNRDRFSYLLSCIHLNDNILQPKKGTPDFDKLYKIRPLLDSLSVTFLNCYNPGPSQSIDESMIRFKGRIGFRQYMPMKPIKRGYKMWVRADQSGFVSEFQIYTGKTDDATEKELGARVVRDLTRAIVGKNHRVYFDNYFSSIKLMQQLLKEKVYACGTIRKNRKGEPKDLKQNMVRGETDWRITKDGILYVKWMDRRPVMFVSNFHCPKNVQSVSRKRKDGTKENVSCLQLVRDYNQHMGYVDKSDMLKALYQINRKSKKWWHRIMWHFLDLTVVNAFIIYTTKSIGSFKNLSLKDFRTAVALGLIGADPQTPTNRNKNVGKPVNKFKVQVPPEIRFDKAAHLPIHGNKVRCALCSARENPHRTRWHCTTCKVGLCLNEKNNCFYNFHKL